jgi:hypothetical protein
LPLIQAKPCTAGNWQDGPGLGLGKAQYFILSKIGDGAGQRLWFGGAMGQIQPTAKQIRVRTQNANESFHRQRLSMRGFQVAKDYRLGGHPLLSSNRLSTNFQSTLNQQSTVISQPWLVSAPLAGSLRPYRQIFAAGHRSRLNRHSRRLTGRGQLQHVSRCRWRSLEQPEKLRASRSYFIYFSGG